MIFYGRNVVQEAIASTFKINVVYLEENIKEDIKIKEILSEAQKLHIKILKLSSKALTKTLGSDQHQGVGIDLDFIYQKFSDFTDGAYIFISEFTYEHNLGAIIRTAECSGLKGVIIPQNKEVSAVAAKTSAGSIFHIPIIHGSIYNIIKEAKEKNFSIFSIERDGISYFYADLAQNCIFVIGGEDKSISDGLRERSDAVLEIPQFGKVNSLNMSVAASIIMYERVRQISNKLV